MFPVLPTILSISVVFAIILNQDVKTPIPHNTPNIGDRILETLNFSTFWREGRLVLLNPPIVFEYRW
jgi:hypothetical protein